MSTEIRDIVAAALESDMAPGGLLDQNGPNATANRYGDSSARMRIRRTIIEEYLDLEPTPPTHGLVQVVTAGPPGAGKTTVTANITGFRNLDADIVKAQILDHELRTGALDNILSRPPLPDGRPLMVNELAGLVHVESTHILDLIRRECMRTGENIVVQTTLSWPGYVDVLLEELASSHYDALHIVSIDLPLADALERFQERWWADRQNEALPHGGRYVPRRAVEACYDAAGSICDRNARLLHQRAHVAISGLTTTIGDSPVDGRLHQAGTKTNPWVPTTAEDVL